MIKPVHDMKPKALSNLEDWNAHSLVAATCTNKIPAVARTANPTKFPESKTEKTKN